MKNRTTTGGLFEKDTHLNTQQQTIYASNNNAQNYSENHLALIDNIVQKSQKLAIVTDLDGTIVPYRTNPNDCKIDPRAKSQLQRIQKYVPLFFLTGRSGIDAVKITKLPGAYIFGTAGWETYKTDKNGKGKSIVSDYFLNLAKDISHLIARTQKVFLSSISFKDITIPDNNLFKVNSMYGPVIVEKKAVCNQYPQGISINFNFNQVIKKNWPSLISLLESAYDRSLPPNLIGIYKLSILQNDESCSAAISPFGEEGKHEILNRLTNATDENTDMPSGFDGLIYFGDTDQDAKAFKAINEINKQPHKNAVGVLITRKDYTDQKQAAKYANIQVTGIEGNTELLKTLANLIEKKYKNDIK